MKCTVYLSKSSRIGKRDTAGRMATSRTKSKSGTFPVGFIDYPYPPEQIELDFRELIRRAVASIDANDPKLRARFRKIQPPDAQSALLDNYIYQRSLHVENAVRHFIHELSENPDMALTPHGLKLLEYAWEMYPLATGGPPDGQASKDAAEAKKRYTQRTYTAYSQLGLAKLMLPAVYPWIVQDILYDIVPVRPMQQYIIDSASQEEADRIRAEQRAEAEQTASSTLALLAALDELDELV